MKDFCSSTVIKTINVLCKENNDLQLQDAHFHPRVCSIAKPVPSQSPSERWTSTRGRRRNEQSAKRTQQNTTPSVPRTMDATEIKYSIRMRTNTHTEARGVCSGSSAICKILSQWLDDALGQPHQRREGCVHRLQFATQHNKRILFCSAAPSLSLFPDRSPCNGP